MPLLAALSGSGDPRYSDCSCTTTPLSKKFQVMPCAAAVRLLSVLSALGRPDCASDTARLPLSLSSKVHDRL
ncbi:hypothetical protein D3C71_2163690 [compost metagenome]|nr:hypothetical protein JaAD80_27790 [Janthinobacterium sp. AD80]